MKYPTLLDLIGKTPLVKLDLNTPGTILAKLEHLNPGGSLKDRSALYMIEQAEKLGLLKPGGTIIEASSGNQGIAAAMIGAAKGYKVIITASEKVSQEKLATLKAYGATLLTYPPTMHLDDPKSYHSKAMELAAITPNSYMLNQYYNPHNADAHYHSLGADLWHQTNGTITHVFGACGSAGHLTGAGRYLKEKNPAVKVIGIDSNNSWYSTKGDPKPYKIEGMGIDYATPHLNNTSIDEIIPVTDHDALAMLKSLATDHGLLLGPSSGALAYGAREYCKNLTPESVAVLIFGDSGRAYLTKNFYQ